MTIMRGDCGGITFRKDASDGKDYAFKVCSNGNYNLYRYTDDNHAALLVEGSSAAIITKPNQMNVLAVIAYQSEFNLYVNHQKVDSVTDITATAYTHGQIGLIANDINNPTDVIYSNAKVWVL